MELQFFKSLNCNNFKEDMLWFVESLPMYHLAYEDIYSGRTIDIEPIITEIDNLCNWI
jgi:hypothetical protein